jgi:hypothetical protein
MKIDANSIGDLFDKRQATRPNSVKPLSESGADACLRVKYASLIDRAKKAGRPHSDAVQQGRRLLLSGELESTEIVRAAAENILNLGI